MIKKILCLLLLCSPSLAFAYDNLPPGGPYSLNDIRVSLETKAGRTISINGCPSTFYVNTVISTNVTDTGCSSMPTTITCSGTSPNINMTIDDRWQQGGCSAGYYQLTLKDLDTYKIQTTPYNICDTKTGQSNYKLDLYTEGAGPNLAASCYESCKTTASELWHDCINGSCVASIKHTFSGDPCSGEPAITDLEPTSPDRCNEELSQKIAQCGGSLNVQSFNFETCTGSCTPDSCSDAYALKAQACGGVMAIATWDDKTCKGTCVNDPLPEVPGVEDQPPVVKETEVRVNPDGSKEVDTTTTTYNSDTNTTYTNTTTTYYNSTGETTGTSTTTVIRPGSPEGEDNQEPSETFTGITNSGFGTAYGEGSEINIPGRVSTFFDNIKNSSLFSFSSGFFNSLPSGGSSVYTINGGTTFGTHTIDLSETMSTGLSVLKSVLLVVFGFLSIRAIIMKR